MLLARSVKPYGFRGGYNMAKPKLGSGERFKELKSELKSKGAKDPGALAGWIGRKKYGNEKMSEMSKKGRSK